MLGDDEVMFVDTAGGDNDAVVEARDWTAQ